VTELDCAEGSLIVLDVWNDTVVCSRSSLKLPPTLVLGRLPPRGREHSVVWSAVTSWQSPLTPDSLACHYMMLTQEEESQSPCSKL
jgi:hypothetical protein